MARSAKKYLKISKGQISKNLVERTDIGILDDSGQEITNFYSTKYGALQTVAGTEFMFNFGKDAKVKLHTIHLSDNKEATLAFDATNQKLYLFDYQGNQLDQISFPYITEENYERSNIAQQEELVLLATGNNPLIRINIANNKLAYNIYTIPAKNIMKVKNIVRPQLTNVFRTKLTINSASDANTLLPTIDPGWATGTIVQPNQAEDTPSSSFPWTVYIKQSDNTWTGPTSFSPAEPLEELFYQNTPGAYSFSPSSEYNEFIVEYAGASGGQLWFHNPRGTRLYGTGGKGAIKTTLIQKQISLITGVIASAGGNGSDTKGGVGGSGYYAGGNGTLKTARRNDGIAWDGNYYMSAGGGGGSTSVSIDGTIYTAGGGGGVGGGLDFQDLRVYAGAGGNPAGGAGGNINPDTGANAWGLGDVDYGNGGNATDSNQFNTGNGYVRILGRTSASGSTIVENIWNNSVYDYIVSEWVREETGDKEYPNTQFAVSATAGIVNITPKEGNLVSITAPAGLDATQYAKSKIIGANFDSDSAIGVVRITEFEGSASGQTYNITKISGPTIVGFDKVYTNDDPATGFKITTSMTPALSGALPSTDDNPTSDTNYPNLITFYQQRLVIFGTQYNQEQVLVSNIGEYDNFTDDYLSTSAFQLVLGSKKKESIRAFCINQGIQLFTNVGEWIMDTTSITRTSGFVQNSTIGTNGVPPIISANGITLFCPKNGKGIVGFIYNDNQRAFGTPYISQYTDLLNTEVKDLFLKSGQDSTDDTLLYICDADGNLIIGNYLQDHNIQGFCHRSATGVKFLQTVQNEENVLLLSSRAGYTTLERIDQTKKTAHSTRLFQYNQESGVITLELPQYQNTLMNVYDENGEYVDSYTVSPEKELYEWFYDKMRLRIEKKTYDGQDYNNIAIYNSDEQIGIGDYLFDLLDESHNFIGISWRRKSYQWHAENQLYLNTYTRTPTVGEYTVGDTQYEITEVGNNYIRVELPNGNQSDPQYITTPEGHYTAATPLIVTAPEELTSVYVSTLTILADKKPQGISEIGYNIHQVFHSNPMNIGAITMTEYKSIARIDLALTSESRHDALTINKKYGRRKGNLVSYIRPQRPTRDCTFTIENDIYPVEILSMEVEIEY